MHQFIHLTAYAIKTEDIGVLVTTPAPYL